MPRSASSWRSRNASASFIHDPRYTAFDDDRVVRLEARHVLLVAEAPEPLSLVVVNEPTEPVGGPAPLGGDLDEEHAPIVGTGGKARGHLVWW